MDNMNMASYTYKGEKYSVGGNGASVATREADVTAQLGMQEKLAAELFDCAKRLEATLLPVLRENSPSGVENPAPEPQLVPLAARIRNNNERISAALATVNSILQRLEL